MIKSITFLLAVSGLCCVGFQEKKIKLIWNKRFVLLLFHGSGQWRSYSSFLYFYLLWNGNFTVRVIMRWNILSGEAVSSLGFLLKLTQLDLTLRNLFKVLKLTLLLAGLGVDGLQRSFPKNVFGEPLILSFGPWTFCKPSGMFVVAIEHRSKTKTKADLCQ